MSGAFLEVQQADMTVQSQSNSKAGATPRKRAVDLELDDGKEGIRGGKSDMAPPQRRGTPYPSKKMKEFDANNASGAMLPPPIFHRTESAVLCGIPPYPPNNKAIMFDDNDLEEKQKVSMDGSDNLSDTTSATHENSTDGRNDEDALQEEEELVSEDDKQWGAFVAKKREKGEIKSSMGLECFLNGQKRWKAANEKLDSALQTYTNKTNDSMQAVIHDLVKQIQASSNRDANELSDDCKSHLVGGHHRREKYLKTLQQANSKSKSTFKALVARTLDEEQPASEANHDDIMEDSQDVERNGSNDEEESEAELWENLANDPNMKRAATARSYLAGQMRLEDMDARFLHALESAEEEWRQKVQSIIELVLEIHTTQDTKFSDAEAFIQSHMVANDHREKQFEEQIRLANESRQAFFSGLMSKVARKAKNVVFGATKKA